MSKPRKLYIFMMVSADGYFEGPHHDLSWHRTDAEFDEFAQAQLDATGQLVFGRHTYELMADFWSSDHAWRTDFATASRMTAIPKVVFSRQAIAEPWDNTTVHTADVAGEIGRLKATPGHDIGVFGSSNLSVTLLREGLVDELRLMVNPVVLGQGTTVFAGLGRTLALDYQATRPFSNGNQLLTYRVIN